MEYFVVKFFLLLSIIALIWNWLFSEKASKSSKVIRSPKALGILETCQFAYMAYKKLGIIGKQRESRYLSLCNKFYFSKSGYSRGPLSVKMFGKAMIHLFFDYESICKINTSDAFNDRTYEAILELYSGGKPGAAGKKHSEHDPEFNEWYSAVLELHNVHLMIFFAIAVTRKIWGLRELCGYVNFSSKRDKAKTSIQNIIDDRKHLGLYKDNPENFVDFFLQEIDKHKNDPHYKNIFNEHQLVTAVQDLFIAGTETTSKFLESFMMFMCLHPNVQNKIHQEIDSVIGRNAFPIYYDYKSRMNYTMATMYEVHRLSNVLPVMPRMTTRDVEIGGCHLKKKLSVSILGTKCRFPFKNGKFPSYDLRITTKNIYALIKLMYKHNFVSKQGDPVATMTFSVRFDDSYWKEPTVFSPDRFLNDNGQIIQERVDRLLIFGAGPRICVGENISSVVAFTLAVGVLQKYSVKQQDDTEILSINETFGATIGPHPFHISIFDR